MKVYEKKVYQWNVGKVYKNKKINELKVYQWKQVYELKKVYEWKKKVCKWKL